MGLSALFRNLSRIPRPQVSEVSASNEPPPSYDLSRDTLVGSNDNRPLRPSGTTGLSLPPPRPLLAQQLTPRGQELCDFFRRDIAIDIVTSEDTALRTLFLVPPGLPRLIKRYTTDTEGPRYRPLSEVTVFFDDALNYRCYFDDLQAAWRATHVWLADIGAKNCKVETYSNSSSNGNYRTHYVYKLRLQLTLKNDILPSAQAKANRFLNGAASASASKD
jgi:hypothetical protein